MNILSKIIAHKHIEVQQRRRLVSIKLLEKCIEFEREVISMKQALLGTDSAGIIAEIKRGSPTEGIINNTFDVHRLSEGYVDAGACALSILTDEKYFYSSSHDLIEGRKNVVCPILRKDFIIDEYQLVESKSLGADCILLIAACLSKTRCKQLADCAKLLGLEVLLEVHNDVELESHLSESIDIIGVNNRNLDDFTTDINTSIKLIDKIPDGMPKISESGISSISQIKLLQNKGFNGFLIGTSFMKNNRPAEVCMNLIKELNHSYL